MFVTDSIEKAAEAASSYAKNGKTIALVPTMGNLHDGHMTLVRKAKETADIVAVSVFVNPLQFNNKKDLETYPRTLEADLEKLRAEGVDIAFTPTPETMYPNGQEGHTFVEVPGLSEALEGASRPGHFRGVTTVVCKLMNIFRPDYAMFGQKDFQQVAVLQKMVSDMAIQTKLVIVPIVRAENGLALSSRNGLLTKENLEKAPQLHSVMTEMGKEIESGSRDFDGLVRKYADKLDSLGFQTDRIDVVDAANLDPVCDTTESIAILAAAYLGVPRLIDNVVIKIK